MGNGGCRRFRMLLDINNWGGGRWHPLAVGLSVKGCQSSAAT